MIRYIKSLFLCILLGSVSLNARDFQEKGVPYIKNFTPAEYGHKGKVWDIETAPNGIAYMAADKGLLEFDGFSWNTYKGSEGITRSVAVVSDSLIYTGSDLDFGVWKPEATQQLVYKSLYPFKEDLDQVGEEFWDLHVINGRVYFISAMNIYVYQNENLTKIPLGTPINSTFSINGSLYFSDNNNVVYELKDLAPQKVSSFDSTIEVEISGAYQHNQDLILITQKQGLWKYNGEDLVRVRSNLSGLLKNASVFSFHRIDSSHVAYGTILDGIYVADMDGNLVHHLDKNKGLQNNTILSLYYSSSGKVWAGMDYGLSYIDLMDDFTYFYDYMGDFGTGYTAALNDETFYLGTNQGLYRSRWALLNNYNSLNQFKLINGTEGQVWKLKTIDDEILMGHDLGLFSVNGGSIQTYYDQSGVWDMIRYDEYLLAGTYNGVAIFSRSNNEWEFNRKMELILGSCSQLVRTGENEIWVNIPNYGVIKVTLDSQLIPVDRQIFRSSEFGGNDHVLDVEEDQVRILSENLVYTFDRSSNTFQSEPAEVDNRRIKEQMLPQVQPVDINKNYEFYPLYNGFALKDKNNSFSGTSTYPLLFRDMFVFNNEQEIRLMKDMDIPFSFNNIRLRMVVPNMPEAKYQYRIPGEDNWTAWSDDNILSLVDLKSGKNVIEARALVREEVISANSMILTIQHPWFLSWYAYLLYICMVAGIVYLFQWWKSHSLNEQKELLLKDKKDTLRLQEERHKEELKKAEEEKLQVKYEQLKSQLKSKTIELANKAKENEEKNKVLKQLKQKFRELEEHPESLKSILRRVEQTLDDYLNLEDNTFEIQIDELHQEFFEKLREEFTDLTLYDLRLCAYLKMGLDTKEVANLLNIKPSSVYISRSRLRKKLEMDDDEDLYAYLNNI